MKQCTQCSSVKPNIYFAKDRTRKDGFCYICKTCMAVNYQEHKEEKRVKQGAYNQAHKVERNAAQKVYYRKNKEERNTYERERCRTDIEFRLVKRIRSRVRSALKGNQKKGSAVRDLGCSIDELKQHLESKFVEGMSWGNHGHSGWHIDHIIPLSSFDLINREQFLKACHYTNLQPLWAEDNYSKGVKLW